MFPQLLKNLLTVLVLVLFLVLFSFFNPASAQTVLFNVKIHSDASTNLHNEEQVSINPTNPDNVVAVWRDFRLGYRQVGVGYSTDGGQNWKDTLIGLVTAPYPWESDPGITVDRFGNFYTVTLCFDPFVSTSAICVYKSTDGGVSWLDPVVVVDGAAFEDKELMTCDQTGGTYDGNLYVSWTRFFVGPSTIFISSSIDSGSTWSPPLQLSDGINSTQWSVPAVGANGEVYLGWVQYPNIMFCKSTNGGNNFSSPKIIFPLQTGGFAFLNGFVGVYSYPALATDISNSPYRGNLYLAFMDQGPQGDQDIFFASSTDQGETWSTPVRVNDDPQDSHADQFFPWATVNQDGVISMLFYDRRNDPNNLLFDVYFTQSYDGGQTFIPNKRITTVSSYPLELLLTGLTKTPFSPSLADYTKIPLSVSPLAQLLGEYICISSSGSQNNLVWTDTREGNQNVYTAKVMTALLIPKLLLPLNLSYLTDNTPLLAWKDFSYYDTVSYYKLQYSTDNSFSAGVQTIDSLTDTTFTLPDSLALTDTTYYWRVQSFNSSGDSSGYQDETFVFTLDTDAPDIPSLISPADTTNDSTPLFTWNSVTTSNKVKNFKPQIASAPIRYTWQLANDSDFTLNLLEVSDLSSNSYQVPNNQALDHGLTYYWWVRANDLAGNQSDFSSPLQFKYLAYIRGDVNADQKRNLTDIIYLVNYVFKGGPPPMQSLFSGDVNCTGNVNLTDIIFMVNYIFKGGSAPCS